MSQSDFIEEYLTFLDNSPTPYHATEQSAEILSQAKFTKLKSIDEDIEPGDYYMTFNKTMLIAFHIPKNYQYNKNVIRIVATHNDSPVLKIKPNGFTKSNGQLMVNLYPYGGGLWHTWFDRPLGVAGQLIDKDLKCELVNLQKPLVYIPSLAPHLDRSDVYREGFKFNKETHLRGIVDVESVGKLVGNDDVLSHDLVLCDLQKAVLGGEHGKYVYSGRQDNLLSTFCGLKAIGENYKGTSINMLAVFDHEEIGSETVSGAQSELFKNVLNILIKKYSIDTNKSMLISCDVAHALNNNYTEKYDACHSPKLGGGMVIKYSPRYATNNYSAAVIKKLACRYQEFALRNDSCGGSTIGPMLAAGTGIKGVDVGAPTLGMHSIKEVSHVDDVYENYLSFNDFFGEKYD